MPRERELPPVTQRTWQDVPDTDPKATVKSCRDVRDVMAIRVEEAHHRLATVSGWFEVADAVNPFTLEDGALRVQVKCLWYGLRPESEKEWMKLRVGNRYQFVRTYTGEVADNIER